MRAELGVPVLTDVHEHTPLDEVAAVVDVLQTPALLCRQTDFIVAVASCGKPVNLKKGQFLSPWEMTNVVEKARSTGNDALLVCERGVLIVDVDRGVGKGTDHRLLLLDARTYREGSPSASRMLLDRGLPHARKQAGITRAGPIQSGTWTIRDR